MTQFLSPFSRNGRSRLGLLTACTLLGAAALAGSSPASSTAAFTIQLFDTGPQPQMLAVVVGDTITFTNTGTENHDIFAPTMNNYIAPLLHPGDSTTITPTTPGRFSYVVSGFTHSHRGLLIVSAVANGASALSLASQRTQVNFGSSAVLTGHTSLPAGTSLVLVGHPGSRASKK